MTAKIEEKYVVEMLKGVPLGECKLGRAAGWSASQLARDGQSMPG